MLNPKRPNQNSRMWRAFLDHYNRQAQRRRRLASQEPRPEPGPSSYEELVTSDSPRLYWRLNEWRGNAIDSSGNGHDTAVIGFTGPDRAAPGPLRNQNSTAYRMDGTTSRLVYKVGLTAEGLNIDGTKPRTIEAWANASGLGITFVGVWEVGSKAAGQYASLGHTDSETGWQINQFGPSDNFTSPFGHNTWQLFHVVNDPDSATPLKVYINGVQVLDSASVITLGTAIPFAVGQLDSRLFQGTIAEVAVYDKVLSQQQMLARVNMAGYGESPLPENYQNEVLKDAPSVYWRMHLPDENQHLIPDVSGHNLGGDVLYVIRSQPGALLSDPADTSFGWNLEGKDGNTQQYIVGNGLEASGFTTPGSLGIDGASSWTVESWIYPTGNHNFRGVWQIGSRAAGQFASLCTVDQKLYIHTWNGTGLGAGVSIPWDTWTLVHVAYDHTTTTFSVYLNGAASAEYTLTYAVTLGSAGTAFEVGRLDGTQWLGMIDEVAVYKGVLPADRRSIRWTASGR